MKIFKKETAKATEKKTKKAMEKEMEKEMAKEMAKEMGKEMGKEMAKEMGKEMEKDANKEMEFISSNCEIENKKSKFLGYVFSVSSVGEVQNYLEQLKTMHKKATHICYAYILENPNLEKCFDDKEPGGTAGKPILNVLQKQKKSDVLVCVVRYFGGVKLGAGNLTRTYSKCASEAIKNFTR